MIISSSAQLLLVIPFNWLSPISQPVVGGFAQWNIGKETNRKTEARDKQIQGRMRCNTVSETVASFRCRFVQPFISIKWICRSVAASQRNCHSVWEIDSQSGAEKPSRAKNHRGNSSGIYNFNGVPPSIRNLLPPARPHWASKLEMSSARNEVLTKRKSFSEDIVPFYYTRLHPLLPCMGLIYESLPLFWSGFI